MYIGSITIVISGVILQNNLFSVCWKNSYVCQMRCMVVAWCVCKVFNLSIHTQMNTFENEITMPELRCELYAQPSPWKIEATWLNHTVYLSLINLQACKKNELVEMKLIFENGFYLGEKGIRPPPLLAKFAYHLISILVAVTHLVK